MAVVATLTIFEIEPAQPLPAPAPRAGPGAPECRGAGPGFTLAKGLADDALCGLARGW